MATGPECRQALESILTAYSLEWQRVLKKTGMGDRLAHAARPDLPDFGGMMAALALGVELKPLIQRDLPGLEEILSELEQLDADDSVKAISLVFSSQCDEYRDAALRALGRMKNPKARKAISSRVSWLSSAPERDKQLARSLLKEG
jgi:hypothetical protein